jgi:enoyl-CoA hydratase
VQLNRPAVRNAINTPVADEILAFVNAVESMPEIRAGVITGTGTVFCAGADLAEIAKGRDIRVVRPGGFAGFTQLVRTKPWIAALNGSAFGGGAEIAMACELVVAAEGAAIGLPEVKRGMIAFGGGVVRASRILPPALALELLLTGEPITAQRAYEVGLVNRVVAAECVLDVALDLARKISDASPFCVRTSLRLARASTDTQVEAMWRLNDDARAQLYEAADFKEGPRAFVEKRPPVWTDY